MLTKSLSVIGAFAALSAVSAIATAQTPSSSLVKSASITSPAQKTGLAGKWTCASRATIEIAPVSYDTRGRASAWVMVHRDHGEIIASERVDSREVEQLRRLPCGTPDSDLGGVALLG
jgi:hypothetical protein